MFACSCTPAARPATLKEFSYQAECSRFFTANVEIWGEWSARDIARRDATLSHSGMRYRTDLSVGGCVCTGRDFVLDIIKLIERERVSVTFRPNDSQTFERPCVKNANLCRFGFVYGASPIPLELLKKVVATFKAAGFVQIYGLTTGGVTVLTIESLTRTQRLRSCGKPIEASPFRSGHDGQIAPVGESADRLPNDQNMKGYWDRDLDTKRAIRDGWFYRRRWLPQRTYLFIHDRVKDMIVQVRTYPAEIESALRSRRDCRYRSNRCSR